MFGTKADRDVQSYMPLITEINRNFESYASLTNDELRQKTNEFRGRITQHLEGIDNDITSLENQAKATNNIHEKEDFFDEIDKLKGKR